MKRLVGSIRAIPWMPPDHEARLYITDEMPPSHTWGTAFGFAFDGDRILLTRLRERDWDIPGGRIEPGETPEQATVREVREETCARVEVIELLGTMELEEFGPRPERPRFPWPLNVQMYFLCRILELEAFAASEESSERGLFAPPEARLLPTMVSHSAIYEEALRRILACP